MPRKQPNELIAGLFVLAGLAVLLGVVLWLGAADLLKTRGQVVSFYVPQSDGSVGIVEGAGLTCGDGRIGKVIEIEPVPAKKLCYYRARLERTDVTIRRDAVAVVVSPAVGQAKIVVKDFGDADEPADDDNPVRLTGGLDQVMQQLNALAAKLREEMDASNAASVLAKIHGIVTKLKTAAGEVEKIALSIRAETDTSNAKSLLAKVHKSAADINAATGHIARQTDPNDKDSIVGGVRIAAARVAAQTDANQEGSLLAKVHGALDETGAIIKDARPKVDRTLTALASAAEKIEAYTNEDVAEMLQTLRQANTKILKISTDFAVVSEQTKQMVALNRDNIDETIDNLAQVSVNLKSASKEVRRNPWRLLYEPKEKELRSQNLYDAVRAFSDGAEQLDQSIAKLRALKKIDSDDPALKAAAEKIHKRLQEVFEEFSKAEQGLWKELQK